MTRTRVSDRRFIEGWMTDRATVAEALIGAAVLALGINLLAARLASTWEDTSLWLGIAFVALPLGYFVLRLAGSRGRVEEFDGIVVVRSPADEDADGQSEEHRADRADEGAQVATPTETGRTPSEAVPIPGYAYSQDVAEYLTALFSENVAVKRLWDEQPLHRLWERGDPDLSTWHSAEILRQATEYWVLNQLSMRLSEHFVSRGFGEEDKLRRFARSDIPDVLLENRFLKLFSEPIEERPAFGEHLSRRGGGTLVLAMGKDGARYQRFELVLPKDSRVTRLAPATIRVETNRFRMTFEVTFLGLGAVLPWAFQGLYLDVGKDRLDSYNVGLSVRTELKWRGILSRRGWEYYRWLDTFVDDLSYSFEADAFFRAIGWETALTTVAAMRRADANDWYLGSYRFKP